MARSWVNDTFYAGYMQYKYTDGTEYTRYIGPYDTMGKAQGQLTQALKYKGSNFVESGIVRGTVAWEKVDPKEEKKRAAEEKKAKAELEKKLRIAEAEAIFWNELQS